MLHGQYIQVTILACVTLSQVAWSLGSYLVGKGMVKCFSVCLAFVLTN